MKSLNALMRVFFREDGLWHSRIIREWPLIVLDMTRHMCVVRVEEHGLLVIGVYDPHWLNELRLLQEEIKEKINSYFGASVITKIRFVLAYKNKISVPEPPIATIGPVVAPMPLSHAQQQALAKITDIELQKQIKRFFNRCFSQS